MKVKYLGLEPVNNVFGDWMHGDIKEIPDGYPVFWPGFEEIIEKRFTEKLSDRSERINILKIDKKGGSRKWQ